MSRIKKFREGAASFYIVAISTLILVIIAASFAAVIISEVTRTSNDDLAQSAYDSALAGVEEAKLAYYNYQNCKAGGSTYSDSGIDCATIIDWVENSSGDCDMVAKMLGRASDENGVLVQEEGVNNNMQQYYTCVKITNKTKDVLGMVSESNPEYTVKVKFDDGVDINAIDRVKVQWHSDRDGDSNEFKKANYESSAGGLFTNEATMPAVISVGMIQTSNEFSLSDFDMTKNGQTDRGTIYLVPKTGGDATGSEDRFIDVTSSNIISAEGFLKSNDKTSKNLPYLVDCNGGNDYACEVTVNIPKPVGGSRNSDTFMFKVALPYGGPSTRFSLKFYCGSNENPKPCLVMENDGEREESDVAILSGVQISIDSTGRANDLYRRVETRMEMEGATSYPYPLYAVQLLSNDTSSDAINKNFYTTCEYDFSPTCER